jgi:hypothetical protein
MKAKTKINYSVYATTFFVLMSAISYAQDTLPYKMLPPVTITATSKKIPERVWKNFNDYFAGSEGSKWYVVNKDYLVKFMTNEDENRALFTKRGSLIYHISYGYEKSMPEDLRNQIRRSYLDYNITRAFKVTEADRVIWVVNVESDKALIIVRLEDGEMEEVQNLKKDS